ncbi:hypothetical protein [Desulfosoma caldarium]|uniref:Glycosyltransferase involved in cell wall biosynthesis n=1 Tax=Desulfosoma caldarium TaxID=610254 RepID=A0A3N1UYH3_9BACT|nr:hypothetical protein [Desulfosoma caldarium]ROQ93607.1 hypothetical protein EDC27_1638 [Desulfosoma caldarium]
MTDPQNLVLFHYHLLRGGVRTALLRSLQCLSQQGWLAERRLVLSVGRLDGVRSFARTIKTWVSDVEVIVDERLDYRDAPWPDEKAFRKDVTALRDTMLTWGGESALFWLHNPTLGKNPAVTAAWKEAAEKAWTEGLPHRFLYHIHDFPECGRVENMVRLHRCWQDGGLTDFYPTSPNTAYAVLNTTDRQRLLSCGLSPQRVFWLPNVVIPSGEFSPVLTPARKQAVASALRRYAFEQDYVFDPGRPQWLLPVRLIRRKNVLEALFLAVIHPQKPQVLITLDATSAQEKPYAEAVKKCARANRLPSVIGFGTELVGTAFSFEELMAWSDAVMTTSLMEGFGFAFLEGPLLGRPLIGRNLADVTADFAKVGFPTEPLYDALPVPLDASHRSRLQTQGLRFAEGYRHMVPTLSKDDMDQFVSRLEVLYGQPTVDFGLLDWAAQRDLLKMAVEGALKENFQHVLTPVRVNEATLASFFAQFGPTAHAHRLKTAFERLWRQPGLNASYHRGENEKAGQTEKHPKSDVKTHPFTTTDRCPDLGPCVARLFFDPLYQRPLFGGWR